MVVLVLHWCVDAERLHNGVSDNVRLIEETFVAVWYLTHSTALLYHCVLVSLVHQVRRQARANSAGQVVLHQTFTELLVDDLLSCRVEHKSILFLASIGHLEDGLVIEATVLTFRRCYAQIRTLIVHSNKLIFVES